MQGPYNAGDPRQREKQSVDGTPVNLRVQRWQSNAPDPTAAATAAETSFSAAQR